MTGSEVISELIFELDASVEAASGFEGEMQRLAGYARCAACPPELGCSADLIGGWGLPQASPPSCCQAELWTLPCRPGPSLSQHVPTSASCCMLRDFTCRGP